MKSADVDQLIERIERLPDSEIIKALATLDDYTIEARVVYESEAQRRGIRAEAVRPVAVRETQRRKDKLAVAWSIKGIGERLYGMRHFRFDGSYQTTKWFVFVHLPIYPICSLRIRSDAKGKDSVVDVLPIDRRQVVDTYAFVVLSWAAIFAGFRLLEHYAIPFRDVLDWCLLGLPFLFLYALRRRARRRVKLEMTSAQNSTAELVR